jgi:hypothetical protein
VEGDGSFATDMVYKLGDGIFGGSWERFEFPVPQVRQSVEEQDEVRSTEWDNVLFECRLSRGAKCRGGYDE